MRSIFSIIRQAQDLVNLWNEFGPEEGGFDEAIHFFGEAIKPFQEFGETEIRERLADLCHKQWSGWLNYMFSKGTFNPDGTWTMPAWAVERWKRQMETPYSELSKSEQDSDRNEADKFLTLINDK